jgi:peptide chain release factor 1
VKPSEKGFHNITLTVEGKDLHCLNQEAGSVKLQRVPPTERYGRVHTSTISVAIVDPTVSLFTLVDDDIDVQWYSGSGAGGQNRNKKQCCCRLIHLPTGTIKTAQFRDRESSYAHAYKAMTDELQLLHITSNSRHTNETRKTQITIHNGDVRTFKFREDRVIDHRTGKSARCKDIMKGNFDLLW